MKLQEESFCNCSMNYSIIEVRCFLIHSYGVWYVNTCYCVVYFTLLAQGAQKTRELLKLTVIDINQELKRCASKCRGSPVRIGGGQIRLFVFHIIQVDIDCLTVSEHEHVNIAPSRISILATPLSQCILLTLLKIALTRVFP